MSILLLTVEPVPQAYMEGTGSYYLGNGEFYLCAFGIK